MFVSDLYLFPLKISFGSVVLPCKRVWIDFASWYFTVWSAQADLRAPSREGLRWGVSADVESLAWDPHSSNLFMVITLFCTTWATVVKSKLSLVMCLCFRVGT